MIYVGERGYSSYVIGECHFIFKGYEDWKCHQADKEVNFRKYECVSHVNGSLISVLSKDIKVRMIAKITLYNVSDSRVHEFLS